MSWLQNNKKHSIQKFLIEFYSSKKQFDIRVTGNSMYPSISSGDMVTVRVLRECEHLSVGDVVFFPNPILITDNLFVVHRIVEIYEEYYVTKGDNSVLCDPMVKKSHIIGVVM